MRPAQREHALAVAPDGDLLPVPAGDAQLGAIEAWARKGRVNSASRVRVTAAAASASCALVHR